MKDGKSKNRFFVHHSPLIKLQVKHLSLLQRPYISNHVRDGIIKDLMGSRDEFDVPEYLRLILFFEIQAVGHIIQRALFAAGSLLFLILFSV